MTQNQRVKTWMENHGSITQREAIMYLHCYRLGARIWELENKLGVPIKHEMVKVRNQDGTYTHVARYSLVTEE